MTEMSQQKQPDYENCQLLWFTWIITPRLSTIGLFSCYVCYKSKHYVNVRY